MTTGGHYTNCCPTLFVTSDNTQRDFHRADILWCIFVQLKREYKFNLAFTSSTYLDENLDILLSCSSSFEISAPKLNIFAI